MGQLDNETTQDDLEGSTAPLGLSRSTSTNLHEGIWTPVIRKGVAFTLGGLALAAIGAISMTQQFGKPQVLQHLTASVPGIEPLEWLAQSGTTSDRVEGITASSETLGTSVAPASPPPPPAPAAGSAAPHSTGNGGILADGRVVLNQATATELQTLPGIGQKRAESILALRERLGGFKKLSDLLRVKGIGVKSLRKLEPKVTLNPPTPQAQPTDPSPSVATSSNPTNSTKP